MIAIDLSGKTAVVTGASQGLGRVIAERLHAAGAGVVVNYWNDDEGVNHGRADEVVRQLGERAWAVAADVRRPAEVEQLLDTAVKQAGRLDFVVNNAAVIRDRTARKMNDTEWQDVIDTNLTGVFQVCRAAATRLQDGGRIVNLASISGVVGFFGQANYSASKAGVIALTKVLCKELASRQITVNAVAPGVVLTEMGQTIPPEVREQMLKQIPLGRLGEPQQIADAVLFLCSDLASYISGQTLHVNGGWWG